MFTIVKVSSPTRAIPFSRSCNFGYYKSESARLESFSLYPGWKTTFIKPKDCARAGFFFSQDGDKVQCVFCSGVVGAWQEGDVPLIEHARLFPECPFILGLTFGLTQLERMDSITSSHSDDGTINAGVDVTGRFHISAVPVWANRPGKDFLATMGIRLHGKGACHKNLISIISRFNTFENWPSKTGQSPEAMAYAGFFYVGYKDIVKCFYCNGGLEYWSPSSNPWLEHANRFPNCTYAFLNKNNTRINVESESQVPPAQPTTASTAPDPPKRLLFAKFSTRVVQAIRRIGMGMGRKLGAAGHKRVETCRHLLSTEASPKPDLVEEPEDRFNEEQFEHASTLRTQDHFTTSRATSLMDKIECGSDFGPAEISRAVDDAIGEALTEQKTCRICLEEEIGVSFQPCGHLIACTHCATTISTCGICREPIRAMTKIYLP